MTNGVHFDVENVTETVGNERVSFDQVKAVIEVLNADMTVDGLIVYFPIFNPEQVSTASVLYSKDRADWIDRTIYSEELYPPGSTLKAFTPRVWSSHLTSLLGAPTTAQRTKSFIHVPLSL
jgi:hypothetical protein